MKKQLLSSVAAIFSASTLLAQLPVSQTADNKNVVLEEFTGIYCTFCPDGHKRAQTIKDANPDDVVLINVHAGGYADPDAGDPDFRTSFGTALANQSGLTGYPSGTVNRHVFTGSATALNRGDWSTHATTILGESAYANVALEASLDVSTREITIDVEVFYTGTGSATNNLNVALLQSHIEGPQTGMSANPSQVLPNGNYEHNHMLRHLITGQWGEAITTTAQGTLIQRQYVYSIPADLNGVDFELGNIEVVAFVAEGNQEIITGAEGPIEFVLPAGSTLVDLASSTSMLAPSSMCDGAVVPEITVSNADTSTVSSYEVSYVLNGGTAITQTVSTALAGGTSATTTFPSITLPAGENKIIYSTNVISSSSNIELVTGNNNSSSDAMYVIPTGAFGTTHEEGFESVSVGGTAFSNAILENPDGSDAYTVSNAVSSSVTQPLGGFGNSAKSFFWNFYSIPSGKGASIVFHKLDFSAGTGYGVKFNHAYAQYQSESDKLEVLVSTDCGATWANVYSKLGASLSTAPANSSNFFPTVSEWKNNTVDLSSYAGESEVMIKFRGTSNYGNNLFVDDIQILDATTISVEENESLTRVNVYPNPSNGNSTLEINLNESALVNVSVLNNLGQVVIANTSNEMNRGTSSFNLNLSELKNGVYFAHVTLGKETIVKQITLLK